MKLKRFLFLTRAIAVVTFLTSAQARADWIGYSTFNPSFSSSTATWTKVGTIGLGVTTHTTAKILVRVTGSFYYTTFNGGSSAVPLFRIEDSNFNLYHIKDHAGTQLSDKQVTISHTNEHFNVSWTQELDLTANTSYTFYVYANADSGGTLTMDSNDYWTMTYSEPL